VCRDRLYREWRLVWLFVALAPVTLALALKFPDVLERPNRAWLKLGLLLNRIVSPVIMLMLFFLVVAPLGFILKLFKGSAGAARGTRRHILLVAANRRPRPQ
jgi:Saxitoxin biosynthesis operon protein SxtJ